MTELLKAFKGKTHTKSQIDLFNEVLSSDAVASLKGARATCVKIAAEMKKNALDWRKCLSIFSEIFSPYQHLLAALFRK